MSLIRLLLKAGADPNASDGQRRNLLNYALNRDDSEAVASLLAHDADVNVRVGVGMGMTMLTLMLALQNAVPRSRLGVATSMGRSRGASAARWACR